MVAKRKLGEEMESRRISLLCVRQTTEPDAVTDPKSRDDEP